MKYSTYILRENEGTEQFIGHVEAVSWGGALSEALIEHGARYAELTAGEDRSNLKIIAQNFHNPLDTNKDMDIVLEILDRDSTKDIKKYFAADVAEAILKALGRSSQKVLNLKHFMRDAHALARRLDNGRLTYKNRLSSAMKLLYLDLQNHGSLRREDLMEMGEWIADDSKVQWRHYNQNNLIQKFTLRINIYKGTVETRTYETVDMSWAAKYMEKHGTH